MIKGADNRGAVPLESRGIVRFSVAQGKAGFNGEEYEEPNVLVLGPTLFAPASSDLYFLDTHGSNDEHSGPSDVLIRNFQAVTREGEEPIVTVAKVLSEIGRPFAMTFDLNSNGYELFFIEGNPSFPNRDQGCCRIRKVAVSGETS